jgi:hypothetical protein
MKLLERNGLPYSIPKELRRMLALGTFLIEKVMIFVRWFFYPATFL